mmetsp:Transcript_13129/g.29369  ORF Transcript_13129/g.29369 Transcript_13129/m.29369 type:complete len:210 (-) Transcript_13129:66-695(-)
MDGCGPSLHLHREGRVAGVANLEQRQQDGEGGAAVQAPRCHLEGAPVLYADALADEQPQTRPLPRLQLVRVELHPLRTYLRQLCGGETRSSVRHGDAYSAMSGIGEPLLRLLQGQVVDLRIGQCSRKPINMDRDRAQRRCELDGVRHEIPQHLRYAHRVAYHLQRLVLPPFVSRQLPVPYRTRERERDILLLRLHGETRGRLLHHLPYR